MSLICMMPDYNAWSVSSVLTLSKEMRVILGADPAPSDP